MTASSGGPGNLHWPGPPLPPPPGKHYYRVDDYHIFDAKLVSVDAVVRTVALCVAHLCDSYAVPEVTSFPEDRGEPVIFPARSGELPTDPAQRRLALEGVFRWMDQTRGLPMYDLQLTRSGEGVFVQDGSLFYLVLMQQEFAQVTQCLQESGLPDGLLYRVESPTLPGGE